MMDDQPSFATGGFGGYHDVISGNHGRAVRGGDGGGGQRERRWGGGEGDSHGGEGDGGMGPMIKDFDELDVGDDHAP